MNMSADVSFQLDTDAGAVILTDMSAALVKQSAEAIAARAASVAGSMSSNPPGFTVITTVGTVKRGRRAIARVVSNGKDAHQNYVGVMALKKSMDAGRV